MSPPVTVSTVLGAVVEPDELAGELKFELMSGVVAQIQSRENTKAELLL